MEKMRKKGTWGREKEKVMDNERESEGKGEEGDNVRFLKVCGSELVRLELACGHFLNETCLEVIAEMCPNLQELNLSSCDKLPPQAFIHIAKVCSLKRLILYRTKVEVVLETLRLIILSDSNIFIEDISSEIVQVFVATIPVFSVEIGTWMRVQWLKSHLDKMRDVGKLGEGLRRYGRVYICHFKESSEGSATSDSSIEVRVAVPQLPLLQKPCERPPTTPFWVRAPTITNSNRSVCDTDIEELAANCTHLRQLDILGKQTGPARQELSLACRVPKVANPCSRPFSYEDSLQNVNHTLSNCHILACNADQ
ncbi:F-box/LRR-repeat protein 4 [Chelonia mydas]|uniref:F-box/LRR-repeat protein 4 n=1 Tax=Chelonia mydas TaxID=8469 RepID=M7C2Q5_CHEMY|nr:F-box/LRR-repeat protein 4 [Chelonia mydas]